MVNRISRLCFAILVLGSSGLTLAGVEYSDKYLHRSDEMVRFDKAYRAGLNDGTTTIIYSGDSDQTKPSNRGETPSHQTSSTRSPAMNPPCDCADDASGRQAAPSVDAESGSGYANTAPRSLPVKKADPAESEEVPRVGDRSERYQETLEYLRRAKKAYEKESGVDQVEESSDHGASIASDDEKPPIPLTPYELDPDFVRNQEVNVEIPAGTIEEIARQMMPRGWRVRLSSSDEDLKTSRFEFISSDPRDIALRKLLRGTGLGFKYFFDLKSPTGMASPLLVISEVKS